MISHRGDIKTHQPHYSGDSHPAAKALELVDKCTRCSLSEQQKKQLWYPGSD